VSYGLFLLHALADDDGFLLIDHVNLIVHEAGHLLFGWLGATLGLWGGTLLELLVPLALVTVGDPSLSGHDWFQIFSSLGLLRYDTVVAGGTWALGWAGMLASVAWLVKRARAN
jgi:hypothetical protein